MMEMLGIKLYAWTVAVHSRRDASCTANYTLVSDEQSNEDP